MKFLIHKRIECFYHWSISRALLKVYGHGSRFVPPNWACNMFGRHVEAYYNTRREIRT